jgi:hypothetical protein
MIKVTPSLDNGPRPGSNGTIHPDVSPVNDAPVNAPDDPQVAQEDGFAVIQGLQVKDVDAGNGIMKASRWSTAPDLPAGSGVTLTGNGTDAWC